MERTLSSLSSHLRSFDGLNDDDSPTPSSSTAAPPSLGSIASLPPDTPPPPPPIDNLAFNFPMADHAAKIKVAEPDTFDGSPARFHDWKRQLLIYVRACRIVEDDDRILLALSYMKSSTANAWATRYFDEYATQPCLGRWQDFLEELRSSFEDKNLQRKAQEKLESFRQGTRRIDEYFAVFDSLLNDAEIVSDEEKIRLIERNVKTELVDAVYSGRVVPTAYITYRTRLLMVGRLWEQRAEQKALDRRGLLPPVVWQRRGEEPACRQEPARHPHPASTDRATGSGTTFRGRGRPMDLDAVRCDAHCYQCGIVSHFKRECLELKKPGVQPRKLSVRALFLDLSAEEKDELRTILDSEDSEVAPQDGPLADAFISDFL
jgi:hypothetical protein